METKKIVLYSFGVGFLAGLILFFNGVVHAQDNNTTEITPPAITEYVPNKLEQTAGSYNGVQYWPYPSWQVAGFVNNCMRTFPTQYPAIQQFLWPQEMGAFCSCTMDKFRQEWAYDDYVQNFQLRSPTEPLPQVLGDLMADYAQECTKKVVEHRTTGIPYAQDPDGKIRRDFQSGKPINKVDPT